MLSESMLAELRYFIAMVIYGFLLAAAYHPLEFLRALVRHSIPFMDAEDILFLSGAGIGFFLVAYRMNDGILRWYAFLGCAAGLFFYLKTVARPLECVRKWLLQKRRKTFKIKIKEKEKNGVSEGEGFTSKSKEKKKKKKHRT